MSKPRRWWFIFWMIWLFGIFGGAEAYAIIVCKGGCTLSESIWFLQDQWWIVTLLLAALVVFLFIHFVVRGIRRWRLGQSDDQKDDQNHQDHNHQGPFDVHGDPLTPPEG